LRSAAATSPILMPGLVLGASEDTTAKTTSGKISGRIENGIYVYRGVPYGMDTAKTRFTAPKPAEKWDGVRDCLAWAPRTIQPYTAPTPPRKNPPQSAEQRPGRPRNIYRMPPDEGGESEDCLHLNVWTPALRDGGKRAVMVYFHGGGYTYGTVNSALYDGNRLAHRGDVVVVTVNGRLNAFGFLNLAELGKGFEDSGMAGMLDLALSLRWIHDNIAEFGGDASRVMIFGQSGGGGKCSTLISMPAAKGLVHRAICMSGQLIAGAPPARATERARAVLKELNLEPQKIDAIRTMPLEQVKEAARAAGTYGPVTDGRSLPHDPFWPELAPVQAEVPLILGNTHDETRYLGGVPGVDLFALEWDGVVPALKASGAFMREFNPEDMVAKYREWHPDYAPRDVYFQITTDTRVWRGEQVAAEKRAANAETRKRTWVYQMDWESPAAEGRYKAPHTMDLPFGFDNTVIATGMVGDTPEQQARAMAMADAVSESYIAFAKTGNPNNKRVPEWPTFDLTKRATMIFDDHVRVENDPRSRERKYIETMPYAPHAG
jgi:para-nitrobenzyl esterase